MITSERLKQLGLTTVSRNLEFVKELNDKCAIAYERFRYVKPENIEKFNRDLYNKTVDEHAPGGYRTFDKLVFTPISKYEQAPPEHVLSDLEEAKKLNCFDDFEIAHIQSVKELVDPILFGTIKGCPDRFFISQWDNDVRIEDILKENEG